MIAHPPCTDIAVLGAKHFKKKGKACQDVAIAFFRLLLYAPIPRVCVENPVSIASTRVRKPDQIIQPWQFGEPKFKKTCYWLRGLPPLQPTKVLSLPVRGTPRWKAWNSIWLAAPSEDRGKKRSKSFLGVAEAMASQWGDQKNLPPIEDI